MNYSRQVLFRKQFGFLKRQFLQDGNLPFTEVLSEDCVNEALATIESAWKDRIFPPLVTLWVFLGQVLSADHSCRAAVARLIAHRVSWGQDPCSAETGAYCQARKRLPEAFFSSIVRHTGPALDDDAKPDWLWKQRRVYMYDGAMVALPDTQENQDAYPQPETQKPGLGYPAVRIVAVFSLACGAVIDAAFCRYAGKGQSELALLRGLMATFRPGDILLADRLMCSWREMAMLKARGVHIVTRLSAIRTADFRRGKRLGKDDHIVEWPRPHLRSVALADESLPESLTVREVRVRVDRPGFRSKTIVVVTTLLDEDITVGDLAELYRARWHNELDLRSLKQTLQMNVLRCKTPELSRKEIWTHLLAYNLIHTMMAQAADRHGYQPRTISFKGTVQTLEAFQTLIEAHGHRSPDARTILYEQILDAIAAHRVADRPDRVEPRRRKRRPRRYNYLTKPRSEYKNQYAKRT